MRYLHLAGSVRWCPEEEASIISRVTFSYVESLLRKAGPLLPPGLDLPLKCSLWTQAHPSLVHHVQPQPSAAPCLHNSGIKPFCCQ